MVTNHERDLDEAMNRGWVETESWEDEPLYKNYFWWCREQRVPLGRVVKGNGSAEILFDLDPANRTFPEEVDILAKDLADRLEVLIGIGDRYLWLQAIDIEQADDAAIEVLKFSLEHSEPRRYPQTALEEEMFCRLMIDKGMSHKEALQHCPPPPEPSEEFMRLAKMHGLTNVRTDQTFEENYHAN